jgi:hypothetical protein
VEIVTGAALYMVGYSVYTVSPQQTMIRDEEDYRFYYRLLTGNPSGGVEDVLTSKDVLMVVYLDQEFVIDNVTISSNTLNIYYYKDDLDNTTLRYKMYLLDKTDNDPNYIEIVK